MRNPSRFWDRIANRYSKQPIADEAAYQHKLAITRGYLRPSMNVLEFGCGTGGTALLHAPNVKHIRAIDISPKMIEIARIRAQESDVTNVTFEVSAIDDLSIDNSSLDAVLGLSILHLVDSRDAIIFKVFQILKPGGIFVSSTACLGGTMKYFKLIAPIGHRLGVLPVLRVFTSQQLKDSLTDAGFEIDYQWQPSKGKAMFLVTKKPGP